nr:hypothetical protein [Tanacetum cinerariifolium]
MLIALYSAMMIFQLCHVGVDSGRMAECTNCSLQQPPRSHDGFFDYVNRMLPKYDDPFGELLLVQLPHSLAHKRKLEDCFDSWKKYPVENGILFTMTTDASAITTILNGYMHDPNAKVHFACSLQLPAVTLAEILGSHAKPAETA